MITTYLNDVEAALQECIAEYQEPKWLYAPVQYVCSAGGKRIRPLLTLLACEAVGGNRTNCLHASIAVEMLHNFTLVHDDIMDSSALRRGRPTVHVQWSNNAAILAGDVMMGIAIRLLGKSAKNSPQPLEVIEAFTTGLIDVCDGQALDLEFTSREQVTIQEYFTMITKKTARLLEMSVAIGALVGGATNSQVLALRTFAQHIGIAFQLQDDLLDIIGSEKFGKTPGGDILEGKRTWLMLRLAECQPNGIAQEFFANHGLPQERIPEVLNALNSYNLIAEAKTLVEHYTQQAFLSLDSLAESDAKSTLKELALQMMGRVV